MTSHQPGKKPFRYADDGGDRLTRNAEEVTCTGPAQKGKYQ